MMHRWCISGICKCLWGLFLGDFSNSTRQDAFHWPLIERVCLSLVGPLQVCLGTPCRWEPGRTSYLAAPRPDGEDGGGQGCHRLAVRRGREPRFPGPRPAGSGCSLGFSEPHCPPWVPGRRAGAGSPMDAGSRRGVPIAPPPLGHLGWSWQHQVDQVSRWATRRLLVRLWCGLLRPEERLGGAWGPTCQAPPE